MAIQLVAQFERYLLTEKCVARNTFHAYKRDIDQLVSFLTKKKIKIEKSKLDDLKKFLLFLKKDGISPRSMARKISSIKALFKYAQVHHGLKNIATDLLFPKLDKTLPKHIPEKEIEKLLNVAEQDKKPVGVRNKIILYLLYVSGMRITEMTKLKCSDIHFDTGFACVHGKGGRTRMIPLPQPMFAMLRKYLDKTYAKLIKKKEYSEYLFPVLYAGKIRPITRQACWIILQKLWKKTGAKRSISPHKLRHSLATHMLKNGADLRSLQMLLGHENVSTVQIYTHVETSHLREIYNKKHPRS